MNKQDIKERLILTSHFIDRFKDRFDYSTLNKNQLQLSLRDKIRVLIDNSIDCYQNVDGAISVWLNQNQEMILIKKDYGYVIVTLKGASINGHDYISKKLKCLGQKRHNRFNRTVYGKSVKISYWS